MQIWQTRDGPVPRLQDGCCSQSTTHPSTQPPLNNIDCWQTMAITNSVTEKQKDGKRSKNDNEKKKKRKRASDAANDDVEHRTDNRADDERVEKKAKKKHKVRL
jgi:hypothetical protein